MNDERAARIELAGDLDVYRRSEIGSAFPAPDAIDRLIVDMRNATLVDSSIIALLMRYRRSFMDAGKDGRDIVLVVPPQLRRIFEITGLVRLLTVVSSTPDGAAIAHPNEPHEPLSEA